VPVCAIARILQTPSALIRTILRRAVVKGDLLDVPREDWTPGQTRDQHSPDAVRYSFRDDNFVALLMRSFTGLTSSTATVLAMLLRRTEVLKSALHASVQRHDGESREKTQIKIVDVYICKLRKVLADYGLTIRTLWGQGYCLDAEVKARIFGRLGLGPTGKPTAETSGGEEPAGSNLSSSLPVTLPDNP
jgi:DNA-binding response OmpR family regulator